MAGGLALRFADSVWLFLPPTVGLLGVSVRQVFGPWLKARGLELSPRPDGPRTKFFADQRTGSN